MGYFISVKRKNFENGLEGVTKPAPDHGWIIVAIAFVLLSMVDVLKLGDKLESILIHATQPPYNAKYPSRD